MADSIGSVLRKSNAEAGNRRSVNQDLPCTLNWGCMVPNSGYLGPNRGQEEGLGRHNSSVGAYMYL